VKEEQFRAPAIRALCRITEVFSIDNSSGRSAISH